MILLFLVAMRAPKKGIRILFGLGAVISLFCTSFVHIEYERLHMFAGWPETWDIVVGIALAVPPKRLFSRAL